MSDQDSRFSLHYYEDVTTDQWGSWGFTPPSGYIAIAARAYDYTYGIFLTGFGIRAYQITDTTPTIVKSTNIGSVQILFMKQ